MTNELSFFEQASNSGREQIQSMNPGDADAFIKLLIKINPLVDIITIINSRITALIYDDNAIIDMNIAGLIGDGINMNFVLSDSSIKDLKSLKGNLDILILDDRKTDSYMIVNGKRAVRLPKVIQIPSIATIFDCSENNTNLVGDHYETDEASIIKKFCNKSTCIMIAVFGDQIGYIERENNDRYYLGKFSMFEYETIEPSYTFKSCNFIPLVGDLVSFAIFESKNLQGIYCLRTIVNLGFKMVATFYEKITLI